MNVVNKNIAHGKGGIYKLEILNVRILEKKVKLKIFKIVWRNVKWKNAKVLGFQKIENYVNFGKNVRDKNSQKYMTSSPKIISKHQTL